MGKAEVYCKKCKYIVECGGEGSADYRCLKGEIKKDYLGEQFHGTLCSKKNKNKKCVDYKKRIFPLTDGLTWVSWFCGVDILFLLVWIICNTYY